MIYVNYISVRLEEKEYRIFWSMKKILIRLCGRYWTSYLITVNLGFLINKIGIINCFKKFTCNSTPVWRTKNHHHINLICAVSIHYCTSIITLKHWNTPKWKLHHYSCTRNLKMAGSQEVKGLPVILGIRCNHVFPSPEKCVTICLFSAKRFRALNHKGEKRQGERI